MRSSAQFSSIWRQFKFPTAEKTEILYVAKIRDAGNLLNITVPIFYLLSSLVHAFVSLKHS
jgi:hypothetical protein